jgi:hypothetical protein
VSVHITDVRVEEMTVKQGRALLEAATRGALGIGRAEFLIRLDGGEYEGTDSEDVIRLRLLAPFGR